MPRSASLLAALALLGPAQFALADDKPTAKTFDSGDAKISYTVQGKGEPVVLIHGWLSSADLNWTLPGHATVSLIWH